MDPQTAYERYVDAILPATGMHELTDSELDKGPCQNIDKMPKMSVGSY